jgi:hypothetical protein
MYAPAAKRVVSRDAWRWGDNRKAKWFAARQSEYESQVRNVRARRLDCEVPLQCSNIVTFEKLNRQDTKTNRRRRSPQSNHGNVAIGHRDLDAATLYG